jgi:hypothetical protein
MYRKQIAEINESIKTTKKAIISLGCSFVQGQGAVNPELYEEYKWNYDGLGVPLYLKLPEKEEKELLKKYPLVTKQGDELFFRFMEYENAFVNVLCKKYFNGEYTPINLGLAGCGNRGTIKELYFYPEVNWNQLEEIIVIYCPSGPERFDFINDQWIDHGHWLCMWPHYKDKEDGPRKNLWKGYSDCVYSEKFEVLEQIAHIQELMLWCKYHNAKLIITPGFDRRYEKDYFKASLKKVINRSSEGTVLKHGTIFPLDFGQKENINKIMELWPWDSMFKPDGYETFADLCVAQEKVKDDHFFNYLGAGSPNGWITACAHPTAKGHDLFAKILHNHITKNKK